MRPLQALVLFGLVTAAPAAAEDRRELVNLPAPMQEHMLANMRDHLRAIEEILAHLAAGEADAAGAVAEARLGLSSLDSHGAAHMAPFMPPAMQAAGTEMHKAASRLGRVAEDAEVDHSYDSQRAVFAALGEITAACNACHAAYRIR